MAVNKVEFGDETLIDLTQDTAEADDVAEGKYFHLASGVRAVGTGRGGMSLVNLRGPVASTGNLPASAPSDELWLVGTATPYTGYFYNGTSWESVGTVSVGPPGQDGFSPEVSVDTITGGHRVTITDADHPQGQSFDVMDGSGGTANYNDLSNKPQIEGVTLSGNKTAADLGLAKASDIPAVPVQSVNGKTGAVVLDASDVGALPDSTAIPSKTSDLTNDSGFVNASGAAAAAPVQSVNGSVGAVTVQPTITAIGILKGNGSGGISAAVAGTDYLTPTTNYSPVKVISGNYTITESDIGKTLVASSNGITFTITSAVADSLPFGAEIAFMRRTIGSGSYYIYLQLPSGYGRANGIDHGFTKAKLNGSYTMYVVKKLELKGFGVFGADIEEVVS